MRLGGEMRFLRARERGRLAVRIEIKGKDIISGCGIMCSILHLHSAH